ncbi:MAG TPA: hypothetical protein QGF35_02165 [Dehalococcoidia bacterium]|nr:hypothetical protein [Dehalococcoidia bacterium]
MRTSGLVAVPLVALVLIFVTPTAVGADGEAGLVVQHGDGSIDAYCIVFDGSGIDGEDLLKRAGVPYEHVGELVCSVGTTPGEGCRGASSFESCTCECRSGGDSCVYWSYFTRRYGEPWVYSIVGFSGQTAGNGDLQAWRWGPGGPSSAPSPADVTFEQVCGHPPEFDSPQAAQTTAPPATRPPSPTVEATAIPEQALPSPTAAVNEEAPSPIVTFTRPAATRAAGGTPVEAGGSQQQPAAADSTGDGGDWTALIRFAGIAFALALIIAWSIWRTRRRGR